MKKGTTRTLMVGLLIAGTASSYASWTVDSSIAASHLGGGPSQRTFSTYAEAKAYVDANPNYGFRILPGGYDDNAAGGSASGSYSSDPRLQLAGQIGYAIGQALHKEIFGDPQTEANDLNNKGIQYCNQGQWGLAVDDFEAALKKLPNDQTIANNLAQARQRFAEEKQEAEERRKQEERERQEAIARKKQETYDRLSSQLKLSNGNGDGLSLKDVRMGDSGGGLSLKDVRMGDSTADNSDSGHVGIRGLPGLYLNDTSGKGTDKPYGIPGLPGLYVNDPGSGLAQTDEARPQAGGAGNEPPATLANNTPNAPPNDNSGNGNALGSRGTYTAATAPEPANNTVTQPASGTPPPQTTLGPVPESLQQQATASQAAAAAPTLEDASAKARAGFDTALPPAHPASGAPGSGARSPATPVPPRTEPTAAVPVAASPAVVQPARTAPVTTAAASPATIPGGGTPENPIKEFLFPGKPRPFPENPDQPLLNPLIEKARAGSLPIQGETAEDFFARFQQSELYRKANPLPLTPWNSGPAYPRGQYPAVDAAVDAALQHIDERETAGLQGACRKAVVAMNAEFAQMERRGIIRAGEDLTKKEETDVVYENALMSARHRVYAQLERDVSATLVARDNALDRLKLVDIPEMQKQAAEANKSDVEKYLFPASKP